MTKKVPIVERLMKKVIIDPVTECWEWQGAKTKAGYSLTEFDGKLTTAHRAMFALLVGPLMPDLEIDHLCKNRGCINPKHLEQVTRTENIARSDGISRVNASRTTCPQGHPYNESNTYFAPNGYRQCRLCRKEHMHKMHQKAEQVGARAIPRKTHCKHGHFYDEANTYWRKNGQRMCRQCLREKDARASAAKRSAKQSAQESSPKL